MLAALIAGACVIAVAGCSGESDADPEPTFTPSATSEPPTASQSAEEPVEPVPPAEMERDDEVGAKAFAEFYWEVATYAQKTGETGLLKRLQLPMCEACTGAREWIEDVYEGGGQIIGSEMTGTVTDVTPLGVAGRDERVGFSAEVMLKSKPGKVVNSAGVVTRRSKAAESKVALTVNFDLQSGWRVGYWERSR